MFFELFKKKSPSYKFFQIRLVKGGVDPIFETNEPLLKLKKHPFHKNLKYTLGITQPLPLIFGVCFNPKSLVI
jgi:hypothetical protein